MILLIRDNLIVSVLILILISSIISGAAIVSAVVNQSQTVNISSENLTTNDTNQTGNDTNQTVNQTIDNQTRDELILNLSQKVSELNVICNESNETAIAEYSGQKLQELKSKVNSSNISSTTKKKLLLNINTALQINNAAISSINNVNQAQAKSELQYEYNILNQINTQIANANRTAMNDTTADNLTQTVNQIKAGHENGNAWIVQNDQDMQITLTSQYYTKIQNKIDEIKNITAQLKAGGVPMEVKIVDASDLQQTENGTYILKGNSSSSTVNGTVKVHAFIPIIVIAVGIYVLEINAAALAAISTNAEIEHLEKTECPEHGKHVCPDCRTRMYELNFVGIFTGSLVTWGIALECVDTVILIEYGLGIIDYMDFINEFSGQVLSGAFVTADKALGDGCNDKDCIFYKYKRVDLTVSLNEPDEAYFKHATTINTIVTNTKYGNASSFKVTLYENTTPPIGGAPPNFAPIATQTISGLSGKNQIAVPFNWTPTSLGSHMLKVVVDPDNEINETVEDNNEDSGTIEVKYHIMKLQLYDTKAVPSTSDPQEVCQVTYYFKAEHPVLLNPNERTPVFIYKTSSPEFNDTGYQVFYPYGAMWQYCSNSSDINGTWIKCFVNPYAECQSGIDIYSVPHWASGSGYYQYFAVKMRTQPNTGFDWGIYKSGILKTQLEGLSVIEYDA